MATMKDENMKNGNKFMWAIILLVLGGGGTSFWQLQEARTDIEILKSDVMYVQEKVENMAPMIVDLHTALKEGNIYDYSAWKYQLNVNKRLFTAVHIPEADRPDPPDHLRRLP